MMTVLDPGVAALEPLAGREFRSAREFGRAVASTGYAGTLEAADLRTFAELDHMYIDPDKLDWQPHVPLREGLATTIEWFQGVDLSEFRAPTPNY